MKIHVQPQQNDELTLLKKLELFHDLREYELDYIAANSEIISVSKGKPVLTAGANADAMFAVQSGRIGIISVGRNDEVAVAQIFSGESFGEIDFFGGTEVSSSAIADEDSTLLRIPKKGQSIDALCGSNPDLTARLLMRITSIMASRVYDIRLMMKEKESWVHDLRRQLLCDKMTGLFNQTFINEELPSVLESSGNSWGFLMIKPDNFKEINDEGGHEAGDRVLVMLAIFLQSELGEDDIAIRFKGDEFTAILKGYTREQAAEKAKAIGKAFGGIDLTRILPKLAIRIKISVGIAMYPEDAASAAELITLSHSRMFSARKAGGGRIAAGGVL